MFPEISIGNNKNIKLKINFNPENFYYSLKQGNITNI